MHLCQEEKSSSVPSTFSPEEFHPDLLCHPLKHSSVASSSRRITLFHFLHKEKGDRPVLFATAPPVTDTGLVRDTEFRSSCPGWSAVVRSWLPTTSASRLSSPHEQQIPSYQLLPPRAASSPGFLSAIQFANENSLLKCLLTDFFLHK
ncbi:hypothetical protein AAY473_025384 [Plecturocebus cupreus]